MSEVAKNIETNLRTLRDEIANTGVELIAVSKTKSVEEIQFAYDYGQRAFGENLVQEMVDKIPQLPQDIEWHMIGHLQSNKVKYIAEFVHLIHSVDSVKLLAEIDKQAKKHDRIVDCLLQVHIAIEDSKFGLDHVELIELLRDEKLGEYANIRIRGLMGIASNTQNQREIKDEFHELKTLFDGIKLSFFRKIESFDTLSMGMSSDYGIALEEGSTMIRVGSTIFGKRVIKHFRPAAQKEVSPPAESFSNEEK